MSALQLDTPLASISGIGPKFLSRLEKLGVANVRDLVWHFPSRYEDFSLVVPIADLEPGQHATISGVVREIRVRHSFRRRMSIIDAIVDDESGSIRITWFNQPYLKNVLAPGRHANFSGKVIAGEREIYLSHPTHELIADDEQQRPTRHTARLVPIYPETRGLTSKALRFLMQPILENLVVPPEYLPTTLLKSSHLPTLKQALHDIHFPATLDAALAAKRRFSFEDIFFLQLFNFQQKLALAREKAPVITANIEKVKEILAALPFSLTPSQKKSLWEILQDMAKPQPMNRLLQGDVGSGKTVVAVLAALMAAESNLQTVLMAPTEVLALQHFETVKKLLAQVDAAEEQEVSVSASAPSRLASCLPIGFLTAGSAKIFYGADLESTPSKKEMQLMIARGQIKIIIGTHALIQKTLGFEKLGLVIIDEQHRFGVRQRATLLKNAATLAPHFLSMSATPIPRTLMLTIFGDLDISTITELPAGRRRIETRIVPPHERTEAYRFIRQQIEQGRQAFVICPRIEPRSLEDTKDTSRNAWTHSSAHRMPIPDPTIEVKSVKEEYEKLSQKIFPDLRVAMLHGQMKPKEKEAVMRDFKKGASDVLVSTSVIEVGVDVPNATIMMIEGAERFGLAQLYQFRGRVGRGEHQSSCLLFTESEAKTTQARLKALQEAKNGFELAEKDLKIRGPGEFLGNAQTGLPDLAMDSLQDLSLIKAAREAAATLTNNDPRLRNHPMLKEKIVELRKRLHQE